MPEALLDRPMSFLYHLCLKQSPVPCATMHDWFCQIELIESILQNKAELRESSISLLAKHSVRQLYVRNIHSSILEDPHHMRGLSHHMLTLCMRPVWKLWRETVHTLINSRTFQNNRPITRN